MDLSCRESATIKKSTAKLFKQNIMLVYFSYFLVLYFGYIESNVVVLWGFVCCLLLYNCLLIRPSL